MKYRLSLQRKRDADYVHTDTKITPAGIPRASPKFRALDSKFDAVVVERRADNFLDTSQLVERRHLNIAACGLGCDIV